MVTFAWFLPRCFSECRAGSHLKSPSPVTLFCFFLIYFGGFWGSHMVVLRASGFELLDHSWPCLGEPHTMQGIEPQFLWEQGKCLKSLFYCLWLCDILFNFVQADRKITSTLNRKKLINPFYSVIHLNIFYSPVNYLLIVSGLWWKRLQAGQNWVTDSIPQSKFISNKHCN